MKCSQALKIAGLLAAAVAVYTMITMYPDMKRYIKLESM